MIKKNIKQSIAGLFLILIIMSCGKENDNEQFSPCASGVDSLGFELLWNKAFSINNNTGFSYPNIIPPAILEDDIIIYQIPTDDFNRVRLIKERISTGEIIQEIETEVKLNTNSLIVKGVIIYIENLIGSYYSIRMIDLKTFEEELLIKDDINIFNIEYIEQVTSNGQLIIIISKRDSDNNSYKETTSIDLKTKEVEVLFNSKIFLDTLGCTKITNPKLWNSANGNKLVFAVDCSSEIKNRGLYIFDVSSQKIDNKILLPEAKILYTEVTNNQLITYYKYNNYSSIDIKNIYGRNIANYSLENGKLNWERQVDDDYEKFFDIIREDDKLLLLTRSSNQFFYKYIWDIAEIDINTGTELNIVTDLVNSNAIKDQFRFSEYHKGQLFYISESHSRNFVSLDLETNCATRMKSIVYDSNFHHFLDFHIDKKTDILYIFKERGLAAFKINY